MIPEAYPTGSGAEPGPPPKSGRGIVRAQASGESPAGLRFGLPVPLASEHSPRVKWTFFSSAASIATIVGGGLLVTGCISPARRLDSTIIGQLHEHSSTRDQVEKVLGKPGEVLAASNGQALVRYWYTMPAASTEASRVRRAEHPGDLLVRLLTILYDPRGIIDRMLISESVTPVVRDQKYISVGPFLSRAELSRVEKGKTTSAEVKELFGPPTSVTFDLDGKTIMRWIYVRRHAQYRLDKDHRELFVITDKRDTVCDFFFGDPPRAAQHAVPETL